MSTEGGLTGVIRAHRPGSVRGQTSFAVTPVSEAGIEIRILGPLELVVAGQTATPRSARACKLLALLAANANAAVPVDRIVDTLWTDPPDSARQQIHNVVSRLRRVLGTKGQKQARITTGSDSYRLIIPAGAVDAIYFQTLLDDAERAEAEGAIDEAVDLLESALALWRGPVFSGLSGAQLANTATILVDQRLTAAEHLAELRLDRGDAHTFLGSLLELVAEHPFREPLRAVLMKVLYRSGRQAQAIEVYEEGRRILADELGLYPSAILRSAHQLILDGAPLDMAFAADPKRQARPERQDTAAKAAGGRDPVAPNVLPRDIPEFTGRRTEIRQLVSLVKRSGATAPVVSAINGMGGVGKTALAVRLAHKLQKDYPDGQYFVDLLGFTADAHPLAPHHALGLLLRLSGTPFELIPSEFEARVAAWRSRLAGRRVLLVLDNASDAAQIRPLLPGSPGTLVLVSSRRRLTSLEGAAPLSLDAMPQTDAVSLFNRIVGEERTGARPDMVASVVESCGRLPLAVQLVAARFRDRQSWPIAYLAEQLRDEESRSRLLAVGDRDVFATLGWSYRGLDERQRRLFTLLGAHCEGEFDAAAAAALTGVSRKEAELCMEELFEVSLLEQPAPGRYRFHDLIRAWAREKLERHCVARSESSMPPSRSIRRLDNSCLSGTASPALPPAPLVRPAGNPGEDPDV